MRATAHIHALYANSLAVIGHGRGWIIMDSTRIYQTASGWVYEVCAPLGRIARHATHIGSVLRWDVSQAVP